MSEEEMYARLSAGIIDGDGEQVVAAVKEALAGGML